MEQALVFASIVLGVAVAFELENLNRVLRSDKVTWHWAQPAFALFILLSIIAYWWGAASQPDRQITFVQFMPVMFQLVMLVLLAAVSLPDKIGEDGVDLSEYYQSNRRYQWLLEPLFLVDPYRLSRPRSDDLRHDWRRVPARRSGYDVRPAVHRDDLRQALVSGRGGLRVPGAFANPLGRADTGLIATIVSL